MASSDSKDSSKFLLVEKLSFFILVLNATILHLEVNFRNLTIDMLPNDFFEIPMEILDCFSVFDKPLLNI